MATASTPGVREKPFYIESDGQPMGETQKHILNMRYLLEALDQWFASDPMVYVAGNMFVHYEQGNHNRHLSPDVFVVRGVPKGPERRNYRVWEEGRAPDLVIEVTSKSTAEADVTGKRAIYQDILKVSEYFLFDPFEEYLHPRFQGYRLVGASYRPIKPILGRLSSKVLGLHLEPVGELLRLYDPTTDRWLETPPEVQVARKQAKDGWAAEEKARRQAEVERAAEVKARQQAEAEVDRLRRENEELRRRLPSDS
jgi:Uma2 family endonuclease